MIIRKQPSLFAVLILALLLGQLFGSVTPTRAQSSSQVWSDPVNVSNSGSALDPVIVANKDGSLHAIWRAVKGGFRYSRSDDGVTWTPSQTILFPFVDKALLTNTPNLEQGREFPYRLISSPDGVINIFWITVQGDLMFARANSEQLPVPSSWAGLERLGESVLNFDVDITATGEFHVAFVRNNNDEEAGIYYRRSPNGALWSGAVNLYSSQYVAFMKFTDAHVSVSASDNPESPIVLVAWDVPALKRIFMATSVDDGLNFAEGKQVKGPEDTGGYGTPFGIKLGVAENKILMVWQTGEPGATQCTFYSQYSQDAGQTWTDPTTVLDARSLCPEQLNFLLEQDDFFMVMMKFKGANPALMVWNGMEWSNPQVQNELSSFTNPLTFDTILLGCKNETLSGTTLYLAGCDEGTGGDIWVTSRSLEPLDQWFGSTPEWNYPEVLALKPQLISNVVQLPEGGRIHTVWTESSQSETGGASTSLYYARFADGRWSASNEVIKGLLGRPAEISMAVGNQENLYVVWVEEQAGSLVYTTANSGRAGLRTEWSDPRGIPTGTRLNASPDILVDASGKLVIAYSVPFNEGRGIYVIQASGRDPAWSLPVKVFDAVAAEWDWVDNPQITLTSDGKLHVLFSRVARDGMYATGLYYSQSADGGMTWSTAELIREGSITWSEIVSYDNSTLHRFWQEDRNGVVSNFYQVSRDSGITWENAIEITGVLDYVSPVTLVLNGTGDMHFLRIVNGDTPNFVKEYGLVVEDWQWDGTRWSNQTSRTINVKGDRANFFVSGGLTTDGWLSALVSADYLDLAGEVQSQIVGISRQAEVNNPSAEPFFALISTPQAVDQQPTEIAGAQPSGESLPAGNPSPSRFRNLAGIVLVIVVIVLSLYFVRRRAGGRSPR